MSTRADDDDDKTIIRPSLGAGSTGPGPSASSSWPDAHDAHALPAGTRMGELEILRRIGEGGFSIVYLAWDHSLERQVALKEFMPASISTRQQNTHVTVRSERNREIFDTGLRSFVNEAKLLAHFDHPSLIKVHRFWEENGTAYMVMPFHDGQTLKAHLEAMPGAPDEAWLKKLLAPLLDALQTIHADTCYHRDIAPDNILLLGPQLKPLLLDFGAARRVVGGATRALTVILKPGYAPVEQYAESDAMTQGPWTDIYALCAVLYNAITGRPPGPSVGRLLKDDLVPVSKLAVGRYSKAFLAAIDQGLAVRPEDRPQDIPSLRARLLPGDSPRAASDTAATVLQLPARVAPVKSRSVLWPAVAACLALAAGGTWVAMREPAPTVPEAPVVSSTVAPATPGTPAAPVTPAPPMRPEPAPFSLPGVFNAIMAGADSGLSTGAVADKTSVIINKDKIRLRVSPSEAGYVYLFYNGTGPDALALIFPNEVDKNNLVAANQEVVLPRRPDMDAVGPPGDDYILAIVSRSPRDFSGIGLMASSNHIAQFDLDALRRAWPPAPGTPSAYAGSVRCAAGHACPPGYGASIVKITEVSSAKR